MASKYQAPRGTFDVLPQAALLRSEIEAAALAIFERSGYERIATPIFEDTELFERGVGRSTDVVRKEMFTFEDKGGRSITLRPEGTAPICRAYLEHADRMGARVVLTFDADGTLQKWNKRKGDRAETSLASAVDEALAAKAEEAS